MELKVVKIDVPTGCNVIVGQSHFIKTIDDIHEAIANAAPSSKFGVAFCESSGPCLVRVSGNDPKLIEASAYNALRISAGHSFLIIIRDAFPISIMDRLKSVPELCQIIAATANPLEVIIAETDQGAGILGVVDGSKPKGIENQEDTRQRKEFLRRLGYKL